MIITITALCIALYAAPNDTAPIARQCVTFSAPKRYDMTMCPGEVTTSKDGKIATCEINR